MYSGGDVRSTRFLASRSDLSRAAQIIGAHHAMHKKVGLQV